MVGKIRSKINGNGKLIYRSIIVFLFFAITTIITIFAIGVDHYLERDEKDKIEMKQTLDSLMRKINRIENETTKIKTQVTDHLNWGDNASSEMKNDLKEIRGRIRELEKK